MIFKLGKIQIPLTGEAENFDGTMMLSEHELALTNSMIQVTNFLFFYHRTFMLVTRHSITNKWNMNNGN